MNRLRSSPLRPSLLAGLLLLLAPALRAQIEPARPFLWRIDGKVPSYLFGTIHLPDERVTNLPKVVEDAIDACDALYTELPMDLKTTTSALRLSALPRGRKLVDILGEELLDRLEAFFDEHGVPFATMSRLKPWAIATQIQMMDHLKEMSSGAPLDMQLYKRAKDDDKEVGGLETVEEQCSVFDGLTDTEQATFTKEALDSYARYKQQKRDIYQELIDCYVSGSGERLQELMDEEDEIGDKALAAKIKQTLLVDRNHHMADRIAQKLLDAHDKSLFFAVGAAHAFGDYSVVKLLREKGLVVTRLPATPAQELEAKIESARVHQEALQRRIKEIEALRDASDEKAKQLEDELKKARAELEQAERTQPKPVRKAG